MNNEIECIYVRDMRNFLKNWYTRMHCAINSNDSKIKLYIPHSLTTNLCC